jgi:Niemann-Pick C2 protein
MCPFSWQLSVKLFRLIWTQQTTYQLKSLSDDDSDVLTAVVHGVVLGVPFPFNLPNPDGCKDSGVSCPISAGQTYNYKTSLPVLASYPRVTVDVKWELQDKDGNDVVCVLIPSQIK